MARFLLCLFALTFTAVFVAEAWHCDGNVLMCTLWEQITGECPCQNFQNCPDNPCVCNTLKCCKEECLGGTCTTGPAPNNTRTCNDTMIMPTKCVESVCSPQCRNNQCGSNKVCNETSICM